MNRPLPEGPLHCSLLPTGVRQGPELHGVQAPIPMTTSEPERAREGLPAGQVLH